MLEHLKQNSDATIDDILSVIQQREQTVHFVNKQNEPNQTVSFTRNSQLRKEMLKVQPVSTTKLKNAQNSERSMNQGVVRPSAKHSTTARSRTNPQKSVG